MQGTARRPRTPTTPLSTLQPLEHRRLFAVTASVVGTVLTVVGDAKDNTILVYKSGADLVVKGYNTGPLVPVYELLRVADGAVSRITIDGKAGDDAITLAAAVVDPLTAQGGAGQDTIAAGNGPATLWGHVAPGGASVIDDNAADVLVGGASNDTMYGQGGDDTLKVSPDTTIPLTGSDAMHGGNGDDDFRINANGAVAELFGDFGNDTFSANYAARAHWVVFHGGAGMDEADYHLWPEAIYAHPNGIDFSGPRYGQRTQLLGADVEVVTATSYNDMTVDGPAPNIFYGRGGNDYMTIVRESGTVDPNQGGDDTLYGGGGADSLDGGDDDDALFGEAGNDWISGDPGDDYILGGFGNDLMYGGSGNDVVDARDGIPGNDVLYGGHPSYPPQAADYDVAYIDHATAVAGNSIQIFKDEHYQFDVVDWD